jgi:hypothetical protein
VVVVVVVGLLFLEEVELRELGLEPLKLLL